MSFEIKNKVALISGGASGMGLCFAKELLKNDLKGVTLADVNKSFGEKALKEIEHEFGRNKAIFVQVDVSNKENYEEAFKKTITVFNNLDILINNAGILNDAMWEKEIEVNFKGVIHGTLLGMESYIPKYKSGKEGVILNVSSIAGIEAFPMMPIYTGTKFAVMGMSKAFGDEVHYKRTNVKILVLCPGATETTLYFEMPGRNLGPPYEAILQAINDGLVKQKPEDVAPAVIKIMKNGKTGSVWVVEGGQDPKEWDLPSRESSALK